VSTALLAAAVLLSKQVIHVSKLTLAKTISITNFFVNFDDPAAHMLCSCAKHLELHSPFFLRAAT
jgi:hypothetical protein